MMVRAQVLIWIATKNVKLLQNAQRSLTTMRLVKITATSMQAGPIHLETVGVEQDVTTSNRVRRAVDIKFEFSVDFVLKKLFCTKN